MWDPYAEFEQIQLENGLSVYYLDWGERGRDWIAARFAIHAGAREDSIPGEGHYVEHCVTENVPGWGFQDIERYIERTGGETSLGETSYIATEFSIFISSQHDFVSQAFDIAGTMLFNAQLCRCVERERQIIIREFHERYPQQCFMEWGVRGRQEVFPKHWLSRATLPLGMPKTVTQITQDDLQRYYDTNYVPANTSMVIVSGIPLRSIQELLEQSQLGSKKPGKRNAVGAPCEAMLPPQEKIYYVLASNFSRAQIEYAEYESMAALPGTVPVQTIRVYTRALEDLLEEHIRQKEGLCYSFDANYSTLQELYEFSIGGKVHPEALGRIRSTVEHCIEAAGSSERLFSHYRDALLNKLKLMDISGRDACDKAASDVENWQRIVTHAEEKAQLEALTMDDMQFMAELLMPERRWTLLLSP